MRTCATFCDHVKSDLIRQQLHRDERYHLRAMASSWFEAMRLFVAKKTFASVTIVPKPRHHRS
jgi:hypothetical protein